MGYEKARLVAPAPGGETRAWPALRAGCSAVGADEYLHSAKHRSRHRFGGDLSVFVRRPDVAAQRCAGPATRTLE